MSDISNLPQKLLICLLLLTNDADEALNPIHAVQELALSLLPDLLVVRLTALTSLQRGVLRCDLFLSALDARPVLLDPPMLLQCRFVLSEGDAGSTRTAIFLVLYYCQRFLLFADLGDLLH